MGRVFKLLGVLLLAVACQPKPMLAPAPKLPTAPGVKVKPASGTPLRIALIGDSFSVQLDPPEPSWPDLIWQNLTEAGLPVSPDVSAIGGTGYVNRAGGTEVFGERAAKIVSPDDTLVVFIGSRNDTAEPEMFNKLPGAAHAAYAKVRKVAKNATLLAVGPIWPEGTPGPYWRRATDIVHDEAIAAGAVWVDPVAEGWLVGHPEMLRDGVHPNEAGNLELARLITPVMLGILTGQPPIPPQEAPPLAAGANP